MQILKIKLTQEEENDIFEYLVKTFKIQEEKQVIEFCENLTFDVESTLELYTEYFERDENNQTEISSRMVIGFRITFYHDGDEVEVVMNHKCGDCIDDRIRDYYRI